MNPRSLEQSDDINSTFDMIAQSLFSQGYSSAEIQRYNSRRVNGMVHDEAMDKLHEERDKRVA